MPGRGARNLPLYYEGAWDATLPCLPRQVWTLSGVPYMAIGKSLGVSPDSDPTLWLLLGGSTGPAAVFSYAGVPVVATDSPPVAVDRAGAQIRLHGLLGTAGTASTTVGVYRSGTLLASVTLGSGVTDNTATTTVSVAPGDVLKARATAVGSGAEDLTVQMYLS